MRSRLLAVPIMALMVLCTTVALTGCGGTSTPTDSTVTSQQDVRVTGRLTWAIQGPVLPVYQALANGFEKLHAGVTVEIVSYDKLGDLVNMLLDKKAELLSMSPELALECIDTQLFRDLTPYFRGDAFWNRLMKAYMRNLGPKGKTYALPYFATVSALNYNKALFKAAGLAVPTPEWTYQSDFYMAAKKLTRDVNGDGRDEQHGLVGGVDAEWLPVFYSWGAEFLSLDGLKLLFTDKAARESMHFVERLHREGLADVRDPDAEYVPEKAPFVDGLTGMFLDSKPWTAAHLRTLPAQAHLDAGFTGVPTGPKGAIPVARSQAIGLYVMGKNKVGATEFLRYLFSTEAQMLAYESEGFMPTTSDAFALSKLEGHDRSRDPLARTYAKAKVYGVDPISRMILDGLKDGMRAMANDGTSTDELLKAAKDAFYDMLKRRKSS